jgi:DNA-binding transcriptional MerR regulator
MTSVDGELSQGRRAVKSEAAFRTISEVADDLDVPQHVLRFWEGKFPQVKPLKRGGGRRYYRPEDVALLRRIRDLLYSEGYTIKGVQKLLKEQAGPVTTTTAVAASPGTRAPEGSVPAVRPPEPELMFTINGRDEIEDEDEAGDMLPGAAELAEEDSMDPEEPNDPAQLSAVREELEEILAELEQLRRLLQPRER